nr:hypothetical protein [Tanacetum cinerariifolium]
MLDPSRYWKGLEMLLTSSHADEPLAETMTTVNQWMSVKEIEQVVAQRVANAIEAIAIYEAQTNIARKLMSQTERQEEEVAENASNKRKWIRASKPKTMQDAIEIATKLMNKKISTPAEYQTENKKRLDNTSKNNQNQRQPNKRQNTGRASTARHGEKKHYGGSKPLCSKCNYHHNGPCAPKCYKCNIVGHLACDYNAVPPPAADLYRSPKKDISWTGLPEFVDDTVTDYNRPSPTVESTSAEAERPITDKVETTKKPAVRYAEMYKRTSKRRRVQRETTRSQNHLYKSPSHRSGGHRPHGAPMRPPLRSSGHRPHGGSMRPSPRPAIHRVDRFPTDDLKFSSAAKRAPRSKMNSAWPNKPAHSYGKRPFQETTQDLMIILIQRV